MPLPSLKTTKLFSQKVGWLFLSLLLVTIAQKGNALYFDPNGNGTPGNGTWDTTTANWSPYPTGGSDVVWTSGNDAEFFANSNGSTNQGPFTVTVNSAISVDDIYTQDIVTFSGTGSFNLPSGINLLDSPIVAGTSQAQLIFQVPITGSGALEAMDYGMISLQAANTFTGNFVISDYDEGGFGYGVIYFGNNASFGTGSIIWVAPGNIFAVSTNALTITNTVMHGVNSIEGYAGGFGGVTFSNWIFSNGGTTVLKNVGGNITVAGTISGGATLQLACPNFGNSVVGSWTFTGTNTYTGSTVIRACT